MGNFKDLKVWQEGISIAVEVYRLTNKGSFTKDYGLKDQIRRSAVSISSNIAEGDEVQTQQQSINYFYHAKGSIAEILTQLIIAYKIGYINKKEFVVLEERCNKIGAMMTNLIKHRKLTK